MTTTAKEKDYVRHSVNYAEPNWNHAASGIRCRVDWSGAHVYEFKRSHIGPTRIIAYNIDHARAHLEELEREAQEKWEKENEGVESVEE